MPVDIVEGVAVKWPIDFDDLNKGDVISVECLVAIFKTQPHHVDYGFKAMALIAEIKRRRPDLTPKQSGRAIRILNDNENAAYATSITTHALRKLNVALEVVSKGVTQMLTDAEARDRESATVMVSQVRLGAKQARRKVLSTYAEQKKLTSG